MSRGKFINPDYIAIKVTLNCFDENKFEGSLDFRLENMFTKSFNLYLSDLS